MARVRALSLLRTPKGTLKTSFPCTLSRYEQGILWQLLCAESQSGQNDDQRMSIILDYLDYLSHSKEDVGVLVPALQGLWELVLLLSVSEGNVEESGRAGRATRRKKMSRGTSINEANKMFIMSLLTFSSEKTLAPASSSWWHQDEKVENNVAKKNLEEKGGDYISVEGEGRVEDTEGRHAQVYLIALSLWMEEV